LQADNKIFSFDIVIFILLFGLLPIDMINGYLLREVGVSPAISLSQLYKIILLAFLFVRVNIIEKVLVISVFLLLLMPTIYQLFKSFNIQLVFIDIVKIIKYLGSVLAFFYFRNIVIHKGYLLKWIYRWMFFSFLILVLNIFLRLFGLGFPMYAFDTVEIGSKGYFYAGNEVSGVLLILASFLMYWYQLVDKKMLFILVGILSVLTGLYLTSKTAILGTIFTFIYLFIFSPKTKRISIKNIFFALFSFFIVLPIGLYFIVEYLKTSDVMERFSFFWNELDIYTFILSNRNTFLFDFLEIFKKEYNIIEIILGVGQSTFETLNNNHIIELDFFDIYFAYGVIGVSLFLFYISFILIQSKLKSFNKKLFPFASYVKYISIILIIVSFLSGHIFNSGMAAIYIGCVFSLMYYKKNNETKLL
jgi:hypothetical protein